MSCQGKEFSSSFLFSYKDFKQELILEMIITQNPFVFLVQDSDKQSPEICLVINGGLIAIIIVKFIF